MQTEQSADDIIIITQQKIKHFISYSLVKSNICLFIEITLLLNFFWIPVKDFLFV